VDSIAIDDDRRNLIAILNNPDLHVVSSYEKMEAALTATKSQHWSAPAHWNSYS
jgi:hypothetical protein